VTIDETAARFRALLDEAGHLPLPPPVPKPTASWTAEDRFGALAGTPYAHWVLAALAEYAAASGLADDEDFSVSCLPLTRRGSGRCRATTVSVGRTETCVIVLDQDIGDIVEWRFAVPSDSERDHWPFLPGIVVGAASHAGGCLFVVGESAEDWDALLSSVSVRDDMRRQVVRLRQGPPRPRRRSDWHNVPLWEAVRDGPARGGSAVTRSVDDAVPVTDGTVDLTAADRRALVKVRANQARFRALLFEHLPAACALCGVAEPQVLDAAHLVPHAEGGPASVDNGRILCANHHRAFDAGLLRWEADSDTFRWTGEQRF